MSFMHFEGATAAAGNDVVSLTGTLASPNISVGELGTLDGSQYVCGQGGWQFAAWTIQGLVKGNVMKRRSNFNGSVFFTSYQSSTTWIDNKNFTKIYWIRGQYDPQSTGNPLWGDVPNGGNALGQWYPLIPNKNGFFWSWSCCSQYNCSYEGTVFVEIARQGNSATFSTATVNAASDYVTTDSPHGFSTGDGVTYDKDGGTANIGLFDSLIDGGYYYVRALSTTQLAFYGSASLAQSDINRLQINADGTETHILTTTGSTLASGYYKGRGVVST